jgi:hypothetical protein
VDIRKSVLADLAGLPAALRNGSLAASALTLAELIPESAPRDAASLVRELRQTMAELRSSAAQVPEEVDPVDELARRRAARRSAKVSTHADGDQLGS